jgi:glycosyltransferase involved in cell wall biosynthesis
MALRYLLPGQMRFMKEQGFDVIMISADGKELKDVVEQEQCPHIIVPMTRKITPWQDLKCLWKLIKIFRKEKPGIVHTHTPKAGLLGMLAARVAGVKVRIHTVAGLPLMVETGMKYRLLKAMEKLTYAAATQVWPNSPSLLSYIKEHRLAKPSKLNIIAKGSTNGINLQRFSPAAIDEQTLEEVKKSIQYEGGNIYLLCIGRLVKDKGIVELVDVFARLQQTISSLRLVLVGEYEPALDPLPAATHNTIENNPAIIHINWSNQVEYFMAMAGYFVFPSHREGFPNVLLQSGAMQLPVICSAITGNVDIVKHGETGLVFEKGNHEQLESCIRYALQHGEEVKQMAGRLYSEIRENYQREHIWNVILNNYRSLLNEKRN